MLQAKFPQKTPTAVVVNNVIDFKTFFGEHLFAYSGHTGREGGRTTGGPHAFLFKLFDCADGKFVGFQTHTLASQADSLWLGDEGNTDPHFAIPVFKSLPPLTGTLPPCQQAVRLPSTLEDDITALEKWFASARNRSELAAAAAEASVVDAKAQPLDSRGMDAVAWFREVIKTQSLGAQPVESKSSGVGDAAKLRSVVNSRDVDVRVIGLEGSYGIPSFGSRPSAVAAPDWAFKPIRAKPKLRESKSLQRHTRKHDCDVSDEVVELVRSEEQAIDHEDRGNANRSDASIASEPPRVAESASVQSAASAVQLRVGDRENVVHFKRVRKRQSKDSETVNDNDGGVLEKKATKRAHVSVPILDTGMTFAQVQQLMDSGRKLEVWWILDQQPQVNRWRAEITKIHQDSETFDVHIVEWNVDIAGVQPGRLTRRSSLAV